MANGTLLDYAKRYACRGFHIVPLHYPIESERGFTCSCGKADCKKDMGKHPQGRLAPRGVNSATAELDIIEDWFRDQPWNIGIATGRHSGIFVIDIDPRNGGDNSIAGLEAEHGSLPTTRRFLTGGGGQHILFRHPGFVVPNSVCKIGPGIDVCGDGKLIVAPPSRHASGGSYAVATDFHVDVTDPPDWLLDRIFAIEVQHSERQRPRSTEWSAAEEKRILSALTCVSADRRDIWLRIGMALHSTGWGCPARIIWDEWSRTSHKFDSIDQEKTWKNFGRASHGGRIVTLGTLFALAKANGWRADPSRKLIASVTGTLLARGFELHACIDKVQEFIARHGDLNVSEEEVAAIVAFVADREFKKRASWNGAELTHV